MMFGFGQVVRLGDEDLEQVRVVEDERAVAVEQTVQTIAGIRCLGECAQPVSRGKTPPTPD